MFKSDIVAVIPAYNPDSSLLCLVKTLSERLPVLVVNDGSSHRSVFDKIESLNSVTVMHHNKNRGKGAALKTAFLSVLQSRPGMRGVVTVDADGQHLPEDVFKVADMLSKSQKRVIFGVRRFDSLVPWKNRIGNLLTRAAVKLILRIKLADTQTGLRGIPAKCLPDLLKIPFNRYEWETEMIGVLQRLNVEISETPIATVYLKNNRSSHFHPVLDSMKIYFVLLRHAASGTVAALADYLTYLTVFILSGDIFLSVVAGRLSSLLLNFKLAKRFTFRSDKPALREMALYLLQVAVMAWVTFSMVESARSIFGISPGVSKIPVDALLYPVNFLTQKYFIFHRGKTEKAG